MVNVVVKCGDSQHQIDVDPADGVEILKMQITSVVDIEPQHLVITGFGTGPLHDLTDLSGLNEGVVLTVTKGNASCAVPPAVPPAQQPAAAAAPTPGRITLESLGTALENAKSARQQKETAVSTSQLHAGMKDMQARLAGQVRHVLLYERPDMQAKALEVIPVELIHKRASEASGSGGEASRDAIARSLMHWFKHECFSWVNNAPCDHCKSGNTTNQGGAPATPAERAYGAGGAELYKCTDCDKMTRFPRYNDPGKLMETRRGRCGEWANAFTLCLRSMGFEARHVLDWTDHVWSEVWSEELGRWVHMDPCENAWDAPLIYSEGWNKSLTYVIAVSKDEVVDVTARYTRKYDECLARRTQCGELWLAELIESMCQAKMAQLPLARREVLMSRRPAERKELEPRNLINRATWEQGAPLPGRQSGSAAWRAQRGEIGSGTKPTLETVAESKTKEPHNLMRSGTHGGSHADTVTFDDVEWLGAKADSAKLRGFTVWAGDRWVHGLQAHYLFCDGDECELADAPKHIPSGEQPLPRSFKINPDLEYLSEVRGRSGTIMDKVEFVISKRGGGGVDRVESFGGDGGTQFRFDIPEGHELVAVYGGFGGHLHNIGLHVRPQVKKEEANSGEGERAPVPPAKAANSAPKAVAHNTVDAAESPLDEEKALAEAVKHFFFKIRAAHPELDPNAAAAKAVERAREWIQTDGAKNGEQLPDA